MGMNRCKVCGGILLEDKIKYSSRWRDRSIGINNISALVCQTCGQAYVNKHMAANLKNFEKPPFREEFLKNPDAFLNPEQYLQGDEDRA
jgi:YgiT-type zinc finger domain-containing protein